MNKKKQPARVPQSTAPASATATEASGQPAARTAATFRAGVTPAGRRVPVWTESGVVALMASRTLASNNIQPGENFGSSLAQADALIASNSAIPCPRAVKELDDDGTDAPPEVGAGNPVAPHIADADAVAGVAGSREEGGDES